MVSDCPPRYATPRAPGRKTLGGQVARLARVCGVEAMPWQRQLWDLLLEVEDGVLVHREAAITIGRQNGKSVATLFFMLHRCLRWPNQNVLYASQTGLDSRAKFYDDWWPMLSSSAIGEMVSFRRQSGREAFVFPNGSRIGLVSGSEKSGHGQSVDSVVLDEAWVHQDHKQEQAVRPAMATRRNAQLVIASTAGTEHRSPYLWSKVEIGREAARAGLTDGFAYLEWSADEDADPADPEVWRQAIPALGRTIDEATVRADFQGMPRHEFQRAFLNQWTMSLGDPIIPIETWEGLADPHAPRPESVVLALDIAPRSRSASIVAGGMIDERLCVSVLEHGPGTDWIASRLSGLLAEMGAEEVIVDPLACAPLLVDLGDLPCRLTQLRPRDIVTGAAVFLNAAQNDRLRHRGERELAVALDGAAQRTLGDGFAFSRRQSGADITPLVATTLLCWAFHGEL